MTDFNLCIEETDEDRFQEYHPKENLTQEEMMEELGITQEELDAIDVEIESD